MSFVEVLNIDGDRPRAAEFPRCRSGPYLRHRRLRVDDDLLAAAQREPHTTGVSDTVRTALKHAAHAAARARQIDWLRDGGLESLADPEARAAVWR